VNTLCKFFEIHYATNCAPSPPLDDLVVQCLHCIQCWIMTGDWIIRNTTCFKTLLGIIDKCRGEVKGYHIPTNKIKEAAQSFLYTLVNLHAHFPPPIGPSNISSLPSEAELLTNKKLTSKNISCFVFNKTLMSVVRDPRVTHRMGVTLVLRDLSGKYVWNANLNYFGGQDDVVPENPVNPPEKDPLEALPPPDEVDYLDTLCGFWNEDDKKRHAHILQTAAQRIKDEAALLHDTNFGYKEGREASPPCLPPLDVEGDPTPSRLLLGHLGLLSLDNRPSFSLLQPDPSKPFNFLQHFKNLDCTFERECMQVGVVYVGAGQTKAEQIFDNVKASKEYFDFISAIGWMVNK